MLRDATTRKDASMQLVSRYAAAFAAMKPVNAASISSAVAVKQKHSFQKQTVSVLLYSTTLRMEFVMD
ncbi:hypothetical protein SOVF_143140 [Spinacia oleracea]|nr:hypothetical protein SOVF_143140 [Spinacia oleracea]